MIVISFNKNEFKHLPYTTINSFYLPLINERFSQKRSQRGIENFKYLGEFEEN
jgi:hypothetical protein